MKKSYFLALQARLLCCVSFLCLRSRRDPLRGARFILVQSCRTHIALVILRELLTGGMLGILLGILVIVAIFLFLGKGAIGFTVGLSLLSITLIAATSGAALPFMFHSLGLDPALMSAPFITTVVDILGILIYLNIAKLLLGL